MSAADDGKAVAGQPVVPLFVPLPTFPCIENAATFFKLRSAFSNADYLDRNELSHEKFVQMCQEHKLAQGAEAQELVNTVDIDHTGFVSMNQIIRYKGEVGRQRMIQNAPPEQQASMAAMCPPVFVPGLNRAEHEQLVRSRGDGSGCCTML